MVWSGSPMPSISRSVFPFDVLRCDNTAPTATLWTQHEVNKAPRICPTPRPAAQLLPQLISSHPIPSHHRHQHTHLPQPLSPPVLPHLHRLLSHTVNSPPPPSPSLALVPNPHRHRHPLPHLTLPRVPCLSTSPLPSRNNAQTQTTNTNTPQTHRNTAEKGTCTFISVRASKQTKQNKQKKNASGLDWMHARTRPRCLPYLTLP